MPRPKLVSDWKGGYVKSKRQIRNGWGSMPSGTIFYVEDSAITAHLRSEPCKCCGFQFSFTMRGRNKFDDFEWLGYEVNKEQEQSHG